MRLTAVAAPEMMRFRDFRHHGCYSFVLIFKRVTMVMPMMRRWRQRVGLRCFTSRRISRLHVLRGVDDCNACCEVVDFDPKKYYGTLTLKGVIDSVEWDAMVVHFITDKARLTIQVDEREIDALYDHFYKRNSLGKVKLLLRLNTYDTPNENVLSYNKNTEILPKPLRTETKILRW